MKISELIRLALEAKEKAYVPYSGFHVGSAVEMEDGTVYSGCNIEVASLAGTLCAERNAIFKGISEGHKKIKKVVVVGDQPFTYPCGICRQVIKEFSDDVEIIIAKDANEYRTYTLAEILPYSFGPEDLEDR